MVECLNTWLILTAIIILWIEITNTKRIYPIVSDMEPLLKTQEEVIYDVKNAISRRRHVIKFIQNEISRYESEHEKFEANTTLYLENPFNRLGVIKRTSIDLKFIRNLTQEDIGIVRHPSLTYPSHEDLEEAAGVISRLHKVYKLNATQLADGLLNTSFSEGGFHTEHYLPMTSNDCYVLNKLMNKEKKRKNQKIRLLWLNEALRKFTKEEQYSGFSKLAIVQEICEAHDVLDDSKNYLKWTQKLLDMKPSLNSRSLQQKIKRHEMQMVKKPEDPHRNTRLKRKKKNTLINPAKEIEYCVKGLDRKAFRMLCRGEVSVPREVAKSLKCWYHEGHHPFTRLAPFKAEQLYIKPNIFLFHDVLSDEEIEIMKEIALPQLDVTEDMSYRLCKGAQLHNNQTARFQQVGQRISDFTGLAASDAISVGNYGVGGFYLTHVDSMRKLKDDKNAFILQEMLNKMDEHNIKELLELSKQMYRIATVLFYLSDVEQGGATVFPALGLTVYPVKRAALFWTNLLPTLDVDYTTCHGACPVLRGFKWVASKWISAENQELMKPCTNKIISREPMSLPFPEIED